MRKYLILRSLATFAKSMTMTAPWILLLGAGHVGRGSRHRIGRRLSGIGRQRSARGPTFSINFDRAFPPRENRPPDPSGSEILNQCRERLFPLRNPRLRPNIAQAC